MHVCVPEFHEIHWVWQTDLDLRVERELLVLFHEYILACHERSEQLAATYACPCVTAIVTLL